MDTKTPPIPLKPSEKPQLKKAERVVDVSLPPLTPHHPTHRSKTKSHGTSWSQEPPCALQHQDHRKKRPYRYESLISVSLHFRVLHIGATPLMHACQQGDRARVLRLLKEQEQTITYRDRTLRNALHYCMDAGTGGAVAAAAPELVNAPDAEGHTPLHLAVIAGDTQLVAVLLANGADVNAKDLEGHSVLHWATVCGETECVRLVLAAGARPSTPDLRGGSPLHYAAQCCGAAATAELAVPKKVGLTILQTLLEYGADVNAKDEDGRQPILWAASAGSVEAVLALARAGGSAAAGTSDKDGLTALHCAASRGHARCVEALVNLCGSHPDHVDDNGQLETLKILSQHGASLHARTVRGTGIGHEAVASGRIELIRWLAKRRPSTLDVATHDGKTPLHVAALHGYLDACKVLLDHGAKINAVLRTSKGTSMTPLDAALYKGHRDCAKLIQMHGGTTAQQLKAHKTTPSKGRVIVVKKSLEKKCEKVVSGRRSKTPRECTKETKVTKLHTRSSTKTSKSGKSKAPDDDTSAADREDRSPSKEEDEPSKTLAEEARDDEERVRSRYQRDVTDSTSQETVERVVVTAMVHKNQAPDTPKSTLEAARETKLDGDLKEKDGTSRDASDENEILSRKTDVADVVEERPPQTAQESSKSGDEIRDEDEKPETTISSGTEDARKAETTDDKLQGRLETLENVTSSDKIPSRETHEAAEDEKHDKSEDLVDNKESASDRKSAEEKDFTTENGKLLASQESELEIAETDARKKSLSDDEQSKTVFLRQDDVHKNVPESNVEDARVSSEEKSETEQVSVKTVVERSPESADEAKENGDIELSGKTQEEKKQKAETSKSITERPIDDKDLDESVANAEGTFSPERTDSPHKKSDYSSSSSPKPSRSMKTRHSRPSTGRNARRRSSSKVSTMKHLLFERSDEHLPHQRAIVAVIDSPEWDEDEAVEKEIREALGEDVEQDTEHEEDNEIGVMRVLPSTSEEETPSTVLGVSRTSRTDFLPQVQPTTGHRLVTINPEENRRLWRKQRRDSGGRDSGIEPSPRVSRIPKRRNIRCCPNTAKQQALNMETITRDVQISLRRYHLERKIFFQLMELKRLQIRHGRANEHVLVKRQVEAFHRSGMSGPTLGVAKYDRPLTFRQFEAFLYEQLRKLQGRPTTPDFCTEAKQCTQKTHRCHHATSAYTSIPVYTYLGGGGPDRTDHLPKIESRGKGQMTVEVTHGEEKQVIALPTEKLDRTKRYFVTFTVRGETQDAEKSKSSCNVRRNAQSV
ncbi:inversin-A [Pseudomyrmex gracilis]|uniref:inversin-A n=1 Tax=Pseudomyrmex gracilis TaxID=219809 RepID=UPI000994D653|nr:inversin-A [Pseudomyrmex gracilis]